MKSPNDTFLRMYPRRYAMHICNCKAHNQQNALHMEIYVLKGDHQLQR
jgi:hypothetical protein